MRIRRDAQVQLECARGPEGTLRVALGGEWKLARGLPAPGRVIEEIERSPLPVPARCGRRRSTDSTLAIGPVEIPDSIDRQQIVTRTGANELVFVLVTYGYMVGKQQSLGVRDAMVTERIDRAGYDALVAAMQRALLRLGQQMGDSVAAAAQMAKANIDDPEIDGWTWPHGR